MKYNRIIACIENKSGGVYQIDLSQNEMDMVANLISQMHNGKIKILKEKLPLYLEKKYFK